MSLKDDVEDLKEELKYKREIEETKKLGKEWKLPFKWKSAMNKSVKKANKNNVLVFYLSAKGEIEQPMLLPLYSGNLIIYKDKAHEFNPRALFNMYSGNKLYKVLIIREIDRKPVSNLDWDKVKLRGDTTRNDEILLKMLRLAMIEKVKKAVSSWIWYGLGAVVLAGIVYFLVKG
jgi:hypothetical protein